MKFDLSKLLEKSARTAFAVALCVCFVTVFSGKLAPIWYFSIKR